MQNIHQMMSVYLHTLSTHLQNNAMLWEDYISSSTNPQLSEELMNLWISRHIEINHQFADQLFQTTLDFHAEAIRFFDKQLMPSSLVFLAPEQNSQTPNSLFK